MVKYSFANFAGISDLHSREACMNHNTKSSFNLPQLVENVLSDTGTLIDNLFADAWRSLNLSSLSHRAGIHKRSGVDANQVVYLLLMWRWVGSSSIAMFCRNSMESFCDAKKDVLYDLLKRPDINWRGLNWLVARAVLDKTGLQEHSGLSAFVIDDTLKPRCSKKMDAVSYHFDHCDSKSKLGHQVVTLGYAAVNAFLPLDSQIKVSAKAEQSSDAQQKLDGRCAAMRRLWEARLSKLDIVERMVRRSWRLGVRAKYLVADSWYGTKSMMDLSISLGITAVLRMKKSKLKYRIRNAKGDWQQLNAKELYKTVAKGNWRKIEGLPWRCVSILVEVDLNQKTGKGQEPKWHPVKLLFVRGIDADADGQASSKDWALFLSTDAGMEDHLMLEVYALRWSIETYFRESKQHLGFLQEQTRSMASHSASIHLCAIRYLILVHEQIERRRRNVAVVRSDICQQLTTLSFAEQLWQFFRSLVHGTVEQFRSSLGSQADQIMQAIDAVIAEFFVVSLQLDAVTMRLEHDDSLVTE